ncbi:ASI1-like protein [Elsinoe fawcettii]|nr:ASI1-like protein [Elsinoe fawcettii]
MTTNTSIIPTAKDLIMVFPRLAQRAGSFAWYLPDQMDSMLSKIRNGGSVIADATAANKSIPIATSSASLFIQNTAVPEASAIANSTGLFSWVSSSVHFEGFRGFGGMFSYFGSRWALATFAVSIFLNRTHFYASSRQNLELKWRTRLLLYITPIVLLLAQTLWVLQAMKCQTSPDFAFYRYRDPDKNLAINFGGEGGFMHQLSSALLFWQDDAASCDAMSMSIKDDNRLNVLGSFSFVWPFFITICISQFVETLSCALQGRQPVQETGMTTFEHSLAFAECEAMISNALGLGVFNPSKPDRPAESSTNSSSTGGDQLLLTRSMILRRLNVPSEVLLISFISCLSHLSSAILAVSGKRHKYRLVNTGIWALCYLSAFIWSFFRVMASPFGGDNDLGILRFPTVCIIGFIPHILILFGIAICGFIYGTALIVTMVSLPPDAPSELTLRQRFSVAFDNLQANVQFSSSSSIKLNWHEDFYTNLLKVGFNILTAASEAVYLNEGSRIKIHDMTWLEQKRLRELIKSHREKTRPAMPEELQGQEIAPGLEYSDSAVSESSSGYAKERKSKSKKRGASESGHADSGLGLSERRSRWELVIEFLNGVVLLVARILARLTSTILTKLGIETRPAWLLRYAGYTRGIKVTSRRHGARQPNLRDFWVIGEDGALALPKDTNVDVEHETRQRLRAMSGDVTEDQVEDNLYQWWKGGGWWGDVDSSGTYAPSNHDDDDLTSVISASESASVISSGWETDGQTTPTEGDPFPGRRQNRGERGLDMADLARLLDPKSAEEREEARILSRHLQTNEIMTRAQYRRKVNQEKARLLSLPGQALSTQDIRAEAELDEERALEQFILEQREKKQARSAQGQTWESGAEGMGAGGPQCVVCQSSPRAILVWPCGCLSICDECRVGVAARNFSSCLCCRTNVVAYSRLYVP